jgi:hypothetical protein
VGPRLTAPGRCASSGSSGPGRISTRASTAEWSVWSRGAFFEEALRLQQRTPPLSRCAAQSIGLKEIWRGVAEGRPRADIVAKVQQETRRFAKRQSDLVSQAADRMAFTTGARSRCGSPRPRRRGCCESSSSGSLRGDRLPLERLSVRATAEFGFHIGVVVDAEHHVLDVRVEHSRLLSRSACRCAF